VKQAAKKTLVCLYKGNENENIDSLRYRFIFVRVADSTNNYVEPKSMPHTAGLIMYHSLRVYRQVKVWQDHLELDSIKLGWGVKNQRLVTFQTDLPPAPKHLLEVVRYKFNR
jgi:hypothetical protein